MSGLLLLIARLSVAALFLVSGYNKMTVDFTRTAGRLAQKGFPSAEVVTWLNVAFELGAVVLLVISLFTRWVYLALALFCIVAAVLFHNFWMFPPEQMYNQTTHLLKNFALVGGLIGLAYAGAGRFSIDAMLSGEPTPRGTAALRG